MRGELESEEEHEQRSESKIGEKWNRSEEMKDGEENRDRWFEMMNECDFQI